MVLHRHAFAAMGTDCALVVHAAPRDEANARRAIDLALAELEALERALSRFDASSGLSQLNAASGCWAKVDERLFRAVTAAVNAREATGGRFDPTVLPALIAAGYDRTFRELQPRDAGSLAGWSAGTAIDLDPDGRRVRLAPGTAIDLGGIGKGLSATVALATMRTSWPQMPGAIVDLGGDIAVDGLAPDGAWRIGVADPRAPGGRLGILALTRGGVATSGRDRRRFGAGSCRHHLIDPATGRPAEPGPLSVTVVAATTAEAEVHATALAITPVEHQPAYVDQRPGLSALVVPLAGRPFTCGRVPLVERSPEVAEAA
jgi:thiamine biosynthesis lipoprotein